MSFVAILLNSYLLCHFPVFQTTEDGRERKAFHGTAEEEDGEGGSEDDEEGPEDCCQAIVTFF